MDLRTLNDAQLIALAFGVNSDRAEEAARQFFPARGEHFAMDCNCESLRDRLKAAVEIDRRMAMVELDGCSTPDQVKSLIQRVIGPQEHESFWAIFLDSQNRVIASREMNIGTATQCSVYPREIAKAALALNSSAVMLAHNHPSGETRPSRADESLTHAIKNALSLVDVRVLDHFVISRNGITSMAEIGLM